MSPRSTNIRSRLLAAAAALFLFACSVHLLSPYYYSDGARRPGSVHLAATLGSSSCAAIKEEEAKRRLGPDPSDPLAKWLPRQPQHAVLSQDWEVLLLLPPDPESRIEVRDQGTGDCRLACLFEDGSTSIVSPYGVLPWARNEVKRCIMPPKTRRSQPFLAPKLIVAADDTAEDTVRSTVHRERFLEESSAPLDGEKTSTAADKEMLRWNHLVYESLSTESDVIVFAKGINIRQGSSRRPDDLRCVFYPAGDGTLSSDSIRTPVTSSAQEVFRCGHPDTSELSEKMPMTITIEYTTTGRAIPSIARYTGLRNPQSRDLAQGKNPAEEKSLICTCTMGYNIAKFLPEWTTYHASIGVDRFFLYDNGSEDDLTGAVSALRDKQGINVTSYLWPWPKTQEAGFSHCAALHRDTCTWMMYVDVDEFVFSPSWSKSPQPAHGMLQSLLPKTSNPTTIKDDDDDASSAFVGQVTIDCYEFGPSGQTSHPPSGVTQGYTCRRRAEERHKSLVRLDAVDPSVLNVVHHFKLAPGFSNRRIRPPAAAVNHYKYQAWPEFRNKFRRRVSAYVVDWTQAVNAGSKDRAPGLGFQAVEPEGWTGRFCEVRDTRLRELARKWFAPTGSDRLVWEDMV